MRHMFHSIAFDRCIMSVVSNLSALMTKLARDGAGDNYGFSEISHGFIGANQKTQTSHTMDDLTRNVEVHIYVCLLCPSPPVNNISTLTLDIHHHHDFFSTRRMLYDRYKA